LGHLTKTTIFIIETQLLYNSEQLQVRTLCPLKVDSDHSVIILARIVRTSYGAAHYKCNAILDDNGNHRWKNEASTVEHLNALIKPKKK
jgi:hypothetical protein